MMRMVQASGLEEGLVVEIHLAESDIRLSYIKPVTSKDFRVRIEIPEPTVRKGHFPDVCLFFPRPIRDLFRPFDPDFLAFSRLVHDSAAYVRSPVDRIHPLAVNAFMNCHDISRARYGSSLGYGEERSVLCPRIKVRTGFGDMVFFCGQDADRIYERKY